MSFIRALGIAEPHGGSTGQLMKKLLLLPFLSLPLLAQQQQPVSVPGPDCRIFFSFTAAGNSPVLDNRSVGCDTWEFSYNVFGYSGLTLTFQSAPNGSAAASTAPGVPGAFVTFGGTITSGSNPATATTQGATLATGYFPFLRMNLSGLTGSGIVIGELHGTRSASGSGGGGGGGGCTGTAGTPCIVAGPDATGSAPTKNPVLVAGLSSDDNEINPINTDTNGNVKVIGDTAEGSLDSGSNPVKVGGLSGNGHVFPLFTDSAGRISQSTAAVAQTDANTNTPATWNDSSSGSNVEVRTMVYPFGFNGATWDRQFACTNQALFNLSGSGNTQIIAASASTVIRICHISMSTTASEDIKITEGTGTNCGTSTTDVTGLYKSVQALAFDFQPTAALRGASSDAICINQSAAQTTGGVVIYAQF